MIAPADFLRSTLDRDRRDELLRWVEERGLWWAVSAVAHALLLSIVMLIAGVLSLAPQSRPLVSGFDVDTRLTLNAAIDLPDDASLISPQSSNSDLPELEVPETIAASPQDLLSVATGPLTAPVADSARGGSSTASLLNDLLAGGGSGLGPAARDESKSSGGFSQRSEAARGMSGSGATHITERSVAAALAWMARHQSPDGSWDLADYKLRCRNGSCSGAGNIRSVAGATSLGLLPFLAAGQTHLVKGPYQKQLQTGIYWLLRRQRDDGDLSAGAGQAMYAHALATIALCEAYGLSGDRTCASAAQSGVRFIEQAQNSADGGWRYQPRDPGDTSVVGWQVMALKSAQMAGLSVSDSALAGARRWLESVGGSDGAYAYRPGQPRTPAMSAVGLLCREYMGAPRHDPSLGRGIQLLLANRPEKSRRDTYYWYYATQVLHNWSGPEWDQWNRTMRRELVETQQKTGCAAGSWDPASPQLDAWGAQGGRLMMTSLSCLTLEVYYRYLPLYKLDRAKAVAD